MPTSTPLPNPLPQGGREKAAATDAPWRLLVLLMAMTAIGPATLNIMVPAMPAIAVQLNADPASVQLTLSLFLISLASGQLVLGPLSDRFGRRPVALAGLALTVIASLAAIAASSIGALIAARIVQGAGAATGIVIGRAIIRDLYDRDRAAAMIGLVTTAMVIAPMVSPLVGGILDTLFGWEAIFIFIASLAGIVFLWAVRKLPETRTSTVPHSVATLLSDWGALLRNGRFYGYVLAGALGSGPYFIFLGGGPHVVVTLMGRTSAEYGLWFALTSFGYMAGNFSVARLAQRVRVEIMIHAGVAMSLIGAVLTLLLVTYIPDGGPGIIFLPQFIISYGNGLLLPNAIAGAVSVRPQASGTAAGLTGFAQMGTGAAATQIISVLMAGATTALPMAWMMLIMVAATAAAFIAFVRK